MTAKQKLHQSNLALWMARFNDQAASGLSVRVWCERNNLSYHAYNYWKHLAKESYVDAIMPDIVPISTPVISPQMPTISIPETSSISPESSESPNPRYIVSIFLEDIKIEIGSNASDEMIDQMSHQMSLFEMYDIFNEAEAASDESKEPDIKEVVISGHTRKVKTKREDKLEGLPSRIQEAVRHPTAVHGGRIPHPCLCIQKQ